MFRFSVSKKGDKSIRHMPCTVILNKWIPVNPNTTDTQMCYTLQTFDEEVTSISDEIVINNSLSFAVYPNPTSGLINISFASVNEE